MRNPVIIFVCKDRVDCLKDKTFPVGLSGIDGMDAPAQSKDYAALLFDDTAPTVPTSMHSNRDARAPLLMVVHSSSRHHNGSNLSEKIPQEWGKPFVCEKFSHLSDNTTFKEIDELISNPKEHAENFAAKRFGRSQREWLEKLGAICELKMIDPSVEVEKIARGYCASLGTAFANAFEDAKYSDKGKDPNWKAALAFVQSQADVFAST